jgi:hypothetical protein
MEAGFQSAPFEARLRCYWIWLNGNVTKEGITRDLEAMKQNGMAGGIVMDLGMGREELTTRPIQLGPAFASPRWRELFAYALAESDRLGLEWSLTIQSGWNLGGPMVKPEEAAKRAVWSRTQVSGPARVEQALHTPPHESDVYYIGTGPVRSATPPDHGEKVDYRGFYRDVAVLAYPLKHGKALPHPIRQLEFKTVSALLGSSMPAAESLLTDDAQTSGEEDTGAEQVLNLTAKMNENGKLSWDAPPGDWEILRFGYTLSGAMVSTSSPTWKGFALDHLDAHAFESYWRQTVAPIVDDPAVRATKSLKYLFTDSWELGGVNWTANLPAEFRHRRGYDLLPYLPVFAGRLVESRDRSNRFLADFRRTLADLIAERHYAVFAAKAASRGLGIHPESGGPHGASLDALQTLGLSTFPQTEFWAKSQTHRVRDQERFFVKEAASAAHIYGRKLVGAEGFTTIGPHWEESIWDNLKPTFDRVVCEGVNRVFFYNFTSSPKEAGTPGQEYRTGTHFNRNQTWWKQSGAFVSYINRVQFLMLQGSFVADVLHYYGEHVPNFVRLKSSDPAHVLPGYDYDVCNEDVLLHRLSVKDGRLVLPDGMSYRLLVLPDVEVISPAALRKVRELVLAGATVVGRKPARSTGLQGDAEVSRLAGELWTEPHSYKGRVISGRTARDVLAADGVKPDFEFAGAGPNAQIDYIHRRTGNVEIYFVSNQNERPAPLRATFRVAGKAPELWLPETGEIHPLGLYEAGDERTTVPLKLAGYGSAVIVFRKAAANHYLSATRDGNTITAELREAGGKFLLETEAAGTYQLVKVGGITTRVDVGPIPPPLPITGSWTVRFPPGRRAPDSAVFESLQSWTEHSNPEINYFSGTATYEKEIDIPAGYLGEAGRLLLDLGDAREIAEVNMNGKNLGIIWKLPRTVDITSVARPGRNQLQVSVTNFWPNRLIGDEFLPERDRVAQTNITKFTRDSPLRTSGLLGPVMLRRLAQIVIQ